MKKYTDLEYLKLSKWERFQYKFLSFFAAIPVAIWNLFKGIGGFFKKVGLGVANEAKDIWTTFVEGDWKTKLSYLVMGFGCIARGQVLRGLLFLLFEVVFIGYMVLMGAGYLGLLPSLGCPAGSVRWSRPSPTRTIPPWTTPSRSCSTAC